ncbi:MAG: glycosyltransferase family 2 protein [Bacteroidales bacterium]
MKTVSVIIPYYKNILWLEESINSVLNQTYLPFEIIVINDGSDDDLSFLTQKYGGFLHVLVQLNSGCGKARLLGLQKAHGDYIAFMDSDDLWLPTKIEKQLDIMESNGLKWSHTGFYNWNPNSGNTKIIDIRNSYGDVFVQSFISLKLASPSVMIRRDVLDLLYNLEIPQYPKYGQDGYIFRELAYHIPLAMIREPLVKVRVRGSNVGFSSFVRIETNAVIYNYIKKNRENIKDKIPLTILGILYIYSILYQILLTFQKVKINHNSYREVFSKILRVLPFVLERCYLFIILQKKTKQKDIVFE